MTRLWRCTLPVALLFAAGSGLQRAEGKPEDPTLSHEGYMWRWLDEVEDAAEALMLPVPEPQNADEILALIEGVPNAVPPLEEVSEEEWEEVYSISSGPDDFNFPDSPWEDSEGSEQHGLGDDDGGVEAGNVTGAAPPEHGGEEAQPDSTGPG